MQSHNSSLRFASFEKLLSSLSITDGIGRMQIVSASFRPAGTFGGSLPGGSTSRGNWQGPLRPLFERSRGFCSEDSTSPGHSKILQDGTVMPSGSPTASFGETRTTSTFMSSDRFALLSTTWPTRVDGYLFMFRLNGTAHLTASTLSLAGLR